MPEIPDLETIRRFLSERLSELTVEEVEVRFPWLVRSTDGLDSLVGHGFTGVRRYGKFLMFDTDDDRVLLVNPMLSGRFSWAGPAEQRQPGTCIALSFSGGQQLRYSDARRMGRWYLVAAGELDSVPGFGEQGPDALEVDEETFLALLARRRGQLKNTLTNQQFVAGIGNAYSDEILWEAGLHPHRRGNTLEDDDRRRLYGAMRSTFEWASTALEAQVRDRLQQREGEWREHLRVHRREGEPCLRCGESIRGQARGGRETNYCLKCQPLTL